MAIDFTTCSSSSSSSSSSAPSDYDLLCSLLRLSRDVSLYPQPKALPRGSQASLTRRCKLLSALFEELLDGTDRNLPRGASLCLREIQLVLQRFKALLADCSARSRMRLLLQSDTVASEFHELNLELATLLDILPMPELKISDDVRDLVHLARCQCRRSRATVNPNEEDLKSDVLKLIQQIEREIVPERSSLESIFQRLGLDDSISCRDEMECLEREIGDRVAQKWTAAMIALVGLVRYAKCVLFGASTPRGDLSAGKFSFSEKSELAVPQDFRCPISLELMNDPVVVFSGQTYDRESISHWFGSGHATCPKTGQVLSNLELIPNKSLKNLIARWCRENNVPFEGSEPVKTELSSVSANKAALEAARMTSTFLVKNLAGSPSVEATNRVVHEICQLAKLGSDNRLVLAEAGAIQLLVPLFYSADSNLQLNAVTALLNLSILEANKRRIMHAEGASNALIHVLTEGATWWVKENAAATVLSLSSVNSYRRRLGRKQQLLEQLVELACKGPASTKKDALAAVLCLAGERENIARLVEAGAPKMAVDMLDSEEVGEIAAAIVAAVSKRGGAEAISAVPSAITKLVSLMRSGTERARESAAAALVLLCRRIGGATVQKVAGVPGVEWVIWELMGTGTDRARRKAASLGRICRKWAIASALAAGEAGPPPALSAVSMSESTVIA
jgi:U-box domain/Armadillo/beta-catenin-like repeat